ncbi:hypothetical protein LIER_08401 [Lithospermum erythrorhizon]|uniref:GAG-pre-integrase domain-containing protein n=1 Tax=Lithospermum erythrorhizon TaxID=34254 RepID=A0AAV3PBR7_LITER
MQLRHKFQHFKKGDLPMVDYLQQLHSIYYNLKVVGEPLKDSDLVDQTLLGLPSTFHAFKTVINAQLVRPSFLDIRPFLLGEKDNVLLTQKDHPLLIWLCTLLLVHLKGIPIPEITHQEVETNSTSSEVHLITPIDLKPLIQPTITPISPNRLTIKAEMMVFLVLHLTLFCLSKDPQNVKFVRLSTTQHWSVLTDPITHLHLPICTNLLQLCTLTMMLVLLGTPTMALQLTWQDQATQQPQLSCSSHGSLYPFTSAALQAFSSQVVSAAPPSSDIWHNRVGHPNSTVLASLVENKFISCNIKSTGICNVCQLGKHVMKSFHSSITQVTLPFPLVFSDVWESLVLSPSNFKYYVVFIDAHTKYTWVYPMKKKSDTLSSLQ